MRVQHPHTHTQEMGVCVGIGFLFDTYVGLVSAFIRFSGGPSEAPPHLRVRHPCQFSCSASCWLVREIVYLHTHKLMSGVRHSLKSFVGLLTARSRKKQERMCAEVAYITKLGERDRDLYSLSLRRVRVCTLDLIRWYDFALTVHSESESQHGDARCVDSL